MTDLEMIEAYAEDVEKAEAEDKTLIAVRLDEFECIRKHAETGALLAEVERLYGDYQIVSTELDDGGHEVDVRCPKAKRCGWVSARSLTAALRDLLGVDGG